MAAHAVTNGRTLATCADFTRRHGFERNGQIMKPAAARQSYGMGGIQHRGFITQCGRNGAAGHFGEVLLGREPRPATEQAIEMEFR